MDPNQALADLRRMAKDALSDTQTGLHEQAIAETFQGLDEWICKGGFLPRDWGTTPTPFKDTVTHTEADAEKFERRQHSASRQEWAEERGYTPGD